MLPANAVAFMAQFGMKPTDIQTVETMLREAIVAMMRDALQAAIDLNVEHVKRQPSTVTDDPAAWVHCEYALGLGVVLLAALCPEASSLPIHVVTIPLLEGN